MSGKLQSVELKIKIDGVEAEKALSILEGYGRDITEIFLSCDCIINTHTVFGEENVTQP